MKKFQFYIDFIVTQHYCCVMMPQFDHLGNLPPGIHETTWDEFNERFGYNDHRSWLFEGLHAALMTLQSAGCTLVYFDGSFVTHKEKPNDYDLCWSIVDVDPDKLDPVLLIFNDGRIRMKEKYYGDLFPAEIPEGMTGKLFIDFFQIDKTTGNPKGIISLSLRGTI